MFEHAHGDDPIKRSLDVPIILQSETYALLQSGLLGTFTRDGELLAR